MSRRAGPWRVCATIRLSIGRGTDTPMKIVKSELTCIAAMKRGEGKKVKGLQVLYRRRQEEVSVTRVR